MPFALSPEQTAMRIEIDDLSRPALHDPLNEHLQSMRALSPPDSVQALDLNRLRQPDRRTFMAASGSILGNSVLRREDPAILDGSARYYDDLKIDGLTVGGTA